MLKAYNLDWPEPAIGRGRWHQRRFRALDGETRRRHKLQQDNNVGFRWRLVTGKASSPEHWVPLETLPGPFQRN